VQGRQHEVSRLEGFSDAVFGFALTLLVVSLDVPNTVDELKLLVRGSVPFALMFAMVCYIWWEHNKFFRRFGLQDAWTAFVNSVLLFVVLFYVYPLKFLTMNVVGPLFGLPATGLRGDMRFVMQMYSAGAFLTFGMLALLYVHAWRQRQALRLDPAEVVTLWFGLQAQLISTGLALVSIGLTFVVSNDLIWVPGVWYGLMGPLHGMNGYFAGAAHAKLKAATPV
jgi:Endosomal/lysosomal potassium channel TMEM175